MGDDYSPWTVLASMPDVTVVLGELEDGYLGWWDPDARTIALDTRQSQRQMRCTLAHELEHVVRGDEGDEDLPSVIAARREIAACASAARRLIPLGRLIDGLLWSQDERELAEELNVDLDTLRVRLMTMTTEEHREVDERVWEAEGRIA